MAGDTLYLIIIIVNYFVQYPPAAQVRISEVNETLVNWKTLVHVVESHRVKHVQLHGSSKSFCHFEFGDSQGIMVSAVVYDDDISHVDGLLLPFKKYYVSAVEICEIPETTPPGLYRFYWVINSKTVVEEVAEEVGPVLSFYFHLRSFESLHFVADTDEFINVMGLIVHAFLPRDVYMDGTMRHGRDYVIVDHSPFDFVGGF
nr:uncharacterized protein LOC113691726 [Coffea arabica]